MKLARTVALLALLLSSTACESLGGVAQNVNINALLASINDAQTAQDAKPLLDGVVAQLGTALSNAKAEGEGAAAEGKGMVESVLTQFGVDAQTTTTINTLLENPGVKTVLGGTLNQLMGMITG